MERKSFVFYTSWLESIENLPKKDRALTSWSIINYGLHGTLPDKLSVASKVIFEIAKKQIDINNKRYMNSLNGGSQNGISNNPFGRRGKNRGGISNGKVF